MCLLNNKIYIKVFSLLNLIVSLCNKILKKAIQFYTNSSTIQRAVIFEIIESNVIILFNIL